MTHLRLATAADAHNLSTFAQISYKDTFTHYKSEDLQAFLDEYYSPEALAIDMEKPGSQFWLVEEQGAIIAYAQTGPYKLPLANPITPAFELQRLYVGKKHTRRGLGKLLLDKTEELARSLQARALYLGVWSGNIRAQEFYHAHGFTKVGEYDYPPIGGVVDREWIMMKQLGAD